MIVFGIPLGASSYGLTGAGVLTRDLRFVSCLCLFMMRDRYNVTFTLSQVQYGGALPTAFVHSRSAVASGSAQVFVIASTRKSSFSYASTHEMANFARLDPNSVPTGVTTSNIITVSKPIVDTLYYLLLCLSRGHNRCQAT